MAVGSALAEVIAATRCLIGPQGGDVDHPAYTSDDTGVEQGTRGFNVQRRESLSTVLPENSDRVDDRLYAVKLRQPGCGFLVAREIRIEQLFTMCVATHLRAASSTNDSVAASGQCCREMLSNESGRSRQKHAHAGSAG
jgi:hypothetical protein